MSEKIIDIGAVYRLLEIMRKEIKEDYVSKIYFKSKMFPLEAIVYGGTALILTGFMTVLVTQVIKANGG